MYFIYILYSKEHNRYYIGSAEDMEARLSRHNNKLKFSTKSYAPWILVYTESFSTRAEALQREKEIKKKKSRKYIEWLVDTNPIAIGY